MTAEAEHFKDNPHVIGFHIDNELGNPYSYDRYSLAAFQAWCRNKYRTLDDLNKAWGTVFWDVDPARWRRQESNPREREGADSAMWLLPQRIWDGSVGRVWGEVWDFGPLPRPSRLCVAAGSSRVARSSRVGHLHQSRPLKCLTDPSSRVRCFDARPGVLANPSSSASASAHRVSRSV